jgi:DNA-directed RNA polymerase specialized sigma24 family protein
MQTMTGTTFDKYVAARSPMLLRFAYVLCGDSHLAEDLVQEVLIRTHRRWSAIEASNPDAYLKQALERAHVSWRRRRASAEVVTSAVRDVAALEAFDDQHARVPAAHSRPDDRDSRHSTARPVRLTAVDRGGARLAACCRPWPGSRSRGCTSSRVTSCSRSGVAMARPLPPWPST